MTKEKEQLLDEKQLEEVVGGGIFDVNPEDMTFLDKVLLYQNNRSRYRKIFGTDEPPKP